MRHLHLAPLLGLFTIACSPEPVPPVTPVVHVAESSAEPPPSPAPTVSAAPRPAPSPKAALHVTISSLVSSLSNARDEIDTSEMELSLAALEPDLRACVEGANVSGKVWLVSRVATSGAPEAIQIASSDLPDAPTRCVMSALASAKLAASSTPLAVSFVTEFDQPGVPTADAQTAQALGMIGLINVDENSPGQVGSAFGSGGLGITGTGGGGHGDSIGLGSIGTIGHGAGAGFGKGNGRLGGSSQEKPPSIHQGATTVSGRLAPEVIRRIVRQDFGRFRLCYEKGLQSDPSLQGTVSVHFVIERDGSVSGITTGGSSLASNAVVLCVGKAFGNLSFPKPEGGKVTVVYPIKFAPGDDTKPKTPAKPPPSKLIHIGGKTLDRLVAADVVHAAGGRSAVVSLDDKPGSPFVVFAESGGEVFAIQRVDAPKKGSDESAPELAMFERTDTPPKRFAIRVTGHSTQLAGELMDLIVE